MNGNCNIVTLLVKKKDLIQVRPFSPRFSLKHNRAFYKLFPFLMQQQKRQINSTIDTLVRRLKKTKRK